MVQSIFDHGWGKIEILVEHAKFAGNVVLMAIIDRLERSGFARRERDERDRRKVLVRALPAVDRRIAPLFEPMQRAMSAAIAGYGENELALLKDFLTRHHKEAVAATAGLQTKASRKAKRDKRQPG